ncbi:metal ABC transporter solute-binding protein, Zn/Mn family [Corynebacterium bouchesdurhonense]|uniref:metal ABC transporter solute-binding protein, Zn/Mn family n=1 Tax=Corynebacterium bouchesdurhonense TaxID=1720192 RepID=UPI0008360A11|nr:zinc ABC transporter substrate-binding protein [Corynebacterium bouchesdurhonense]
MRYLTIAAIVAAASLTACSAAEESGDDEQPGLLATTGVWADVAGAVTGQEVEAIITGTEIDPHHFEPAAQDLAKVKAAATLVANGGGYDASLYTAADQDNVINAFDLAGHDHDDHHDHSVNEHVWFSPDAITAVAKEVQARAGGDAGDVEKRMQALKQKIADLPHLHVMQTESIADHLIAGSEMHDVTPDGYRHAALNEAEPSVSDVAEAMTKIDSGEVDVLIFNPQSASNAAQRLVDAAKAKGVKIVEITELPPAGTDVLDYIEQVTDSLVQAAK